MGLFYVGTMWFVLAMLIWADRFFTNNEIYTAGITIPAEHKQDVCVQDVLNNHKKRRKYMLLCMGVAALPCCIPSYAFLAVLWLTVWLTITVIWDYFLVRTTIRQMYAIKKANGWQRQMTQKGTVFVDTRVSSMKNKMPVSALWFAIPICCLISFILWRMLYGIGDKLSLVMIVCACITLFFGLFLYRSVVHSKLRVYSEDSELNLCINHMTKRLWSGCLLWEVCLCTVYCIGSSLYFYYSQYSGVGGFFITSIFVTSLAAAPMLGVAIYLGKMKKSLLDGKLYAVPPEDEDEYWLDGLYRNPYDSSSFVETRVGIGITANMAKPSMKLFTYGSLLFALVLCLASSVLVAVLELAHIQIEKQEMGIKVTGGIFSEYVAYEDVESVQWYEKIPDMTRTWGSATKQYLFGEFRIKELGGANVFVKRSVDAYILVTCKDGPYLLFNSETEEETKKMYDWLVFQ